MSENGYENGYENVYENGYENGYLNEKMDEYVYVYEKRLKGTNFFISERDTHADN